MKNIINLSLTGIVWLSLVLLQHLFINIYKVKSVVEQFVPDQKPLLHSGLLPVPQHKSDWGWATRRLQSSQNLNNDKNKPCNKLNIINDVMPVSTSCTSLRAGHQVPLALNDGNGVFLNRSGSSVTAQSDVPHDDLAHVHITELKDNVKKQSFIHSICDIPELE